MGVYVTFVDGDYDCVCVYVYVHVCVCYLVSLLLFVCCICEITRIISVVQLRVGDGSLFNGLPILVSFFILLDLLSCASFFPKTYTVHASNFLLANVFFRNNFSFTSSTFTGQCGGVCKLNSCSTAA